MRGQGWKAVRGGVLRAVGQSGRGARSRLMARLPPRCAAGCAQITVPQRDTQFATWTCNLGFPVMGIFPPFSDGTDVNSVDRSKDQQVRAGWCEVLGQALHEAVWTSG